MAPSFTQSERPNLTVPILSALAAIAIAIALATHFFPARAVQVQVTSLQILPAHTVFHGSAIVPSTGAQMLGPDPAQDDLFVVATLHIDNPLDIPVFLSDITATLTSPDDSVLNTQAPSKQDLASTLISFPVLKPLASSPLQREITIEPHKFADGSVLLHFPGPKALWDARKSASVTLSLYHQPPVTVTLPNGSVVDNK